VFGRFRAGAARRAAAVSRSAKTRAATRRRSRRFSRDQAPAAACSCAGSRTVADRGAPPASKNIVVARRCPPEGVKAAAIEALALVALVTGSCQGRLLPHAVGLVRASPSGPPISRRGAESASAFAQHERRQAARAARARGHRSSGSRSRKRRVGARRTGDKVALVTIRRWTAPTRPSPTERTPVPRASPGAPIVGRRLALDRPKVIGPSSPPRTR
jgi:hypothetical protein